MPKITPASTVKRVNLSSLVGPALRGGEKGMISLDTETTGLDLAHGARPFFVTICHEDGDLAWMEWDVDPVTRMPEVPTADLAHLRELLARARGWGKWDGETQERHKIVGQNVRFDVKALATVGVKGWPWEMTEDTLIAGHLLASNRPHDLTSMALAALGIDIEPHERRLEEAVKECRRMVQQAQARVKRGNPQSDLDLVFAKWQIAREGLPCMPSAKGSTKKREEKLWAFDMWLPRAMAKVLELPEDDPWWTVLRDYSNADSSATLLLWKAQRAELRRRNLWAIYRESMRVLPGIAGMETRGVTLSRRRLAQLHEDFEAKSRQDEATCVGIAASLDYALELPAGAVNNSLKHFCFGEPQEDDHPLFPSRSKHLDLPVLRWTDGGKSGKPQPAFDKEVLEEYLLTLPTNSKQLEFVKALQGKRKRDTQLSYMESYERFMLALQDGHPDLADWHVIFPNLNPTGTDTLRMSSSNPNSQQISKKGMDALCPHCHGDECAKCNWQGTTSINLRWIFGPAPGREWWPMDYENIELMIPAYESGEEAMIKLFERANEPPCFGSYHLLNASIVYAAEFNERACPECVGTRRKLKGGDPCSCTKPKVPLWSVKGGFKERWKDSLYQWCKNGGFAIQYGCQERKADATFRRKGAFAALGSKLPKVAALKQHHLTFARKHGWVETIPDRTVDPDRGYPLLVARTEWGDVLPTTPFSYHVQSTAMQATRKAMVRWEEQLATWRREGFDAWLALQVHDELVPDFPKTSHCRHRSPKEAKGCPACGGNGFGAEYLAKPPNLWRACRLKQLMEASGADIGIPLKVALTHCPDTWGEGEVISA